MWADFLWVVSEDIGLCEAFGEKRRRNLDSRLSIPSLLQERGGSTDYRWQESKVGISLEPVRAGSPSSLCLQQ